MIGESELILNSDKSIFHLHLHPEEIADTILLVGDPGRVKQVSSFFSSIEVKKQNREFITHTGIFHNTRLSVVSTGIGTDNIDIVLNELDALANINLQTREIKNEKKKLRFIRIGTSGSLHSEIQLNTPVIAKISAGFDNLIRFYAHSGAIRNIQAEQEFAKAIQWPGEISKPYFVDGSGELFDLIFMEGYTIPGITITAPGFFGPQGRVLRLSLVDNDLNNRLKNFSYNSLVMTNFEMETSAIYALSKLLGHEALTICNIIANRDALDCHTDYKGNMKKLIEFVLLRTTAI